jgi:predicted enzyme related to lactoylglutathione lyase
MEATKMIQQMAWLGLVVKDIPAATEFYTQKLGLTRDEKESKLNFYSQFVTQGGAVLGLINGFEQAGINQPFDTAFMVADADAVYAQWRETGVEMVSEPHDMPFGRTFLFRTPDGHILRVIGRPVAN